MEILSCAEEEAEVGDAKRVEMTALRQSATALVPAALERDRVEGGATVLRAGAPRQA